MPLYERSPTVKGPNPQWNHLFHLQVFSLVEIFIVQLFDHCKVGADNQLGQIIVQANNPCDSWVPLSPPSPNSKKVQGELHIAAAFVPNPTSSAGVIKPPKENQVFGLPLQTLLDQPVNKSSDIPVFISHCFEWISKNGLEAEYLFKQSVSPDLLLSVRETIEKEGQNFIFPPDTNPHIVACTIKLFLVELPEPLLPSKNLSIQENLPPSDEQVMLMKVMSLLSPPTKNFVNALFLLFRTVSKFSATNKMTKSNIIQAVTGAVTHIKPDMPNAEATTRSLLTLFLLSDTTTATNDASSGSASGSVEAAEGTRSDYSGSGTPVAGGASEKGRRNSDPSQQEEESENEGNTPEGDERSYATEQADDRGSAAEQDNDDRGSAAEQDNDDRSYVTEEDNDERSRSYTQEEGERSYDEEQNNDDQRSYTNEQQGDERSYDSEQAERSYETAQEESNGNYQVPNPTGNANTTRKARGNSCEEDPSRESGDRTNDDVGSAENGQGAGNGSEDNAEEPKNSYGSRDNVRKAERPENPGSSERSYSNWDDGIEYAAEDHPMILYTPQQKGTPHENNTADCAATATVVEEQASGNDDPQSNAGSSREGQVKLKFSAAPPHTETSGDSFGAIQPIPPPSSGSPKFLHRSSDGSGTQDHDTTRIQHNSNNDGASSEDSYDREDVSREQQRSNKEPEAQVSKFESDREPTVAPNGKKPSLDGRTSPSGDETPIGIKMPVRYESNSIGTRNQSKKPYTTFSDTALANSSDPEGRSSGSNCNHPPTKISVSTSKSLHNLQRTPKEFEYRINELEKECEGLRKSLKASNEMNKQREVNIPVGVPLHDDNTLLELRENIKSLTNELQITKSQTETLVQQHHRKEEEFHLQEEELQKQIKQQQEQIELQQQRLSHLAEVESQLASATSKCEQLEAIAHENEDALHKTRSDVERKRFDEETLITAVREELSAAKQDAQIHMEKSSKLAAVVLDLQQENDTLKKNFSSQEQELSLLKSNNDKMAKRITQQEVDPGKVPTQDECAKLRAHIKKLRAALQVTKKELDKYKLAKESPITSHPTSHQPSDFESSRLSTAARDTPQNITHDPELNDKLREKERTLLVHIKKLTLQNKKLSATVQEQQTALNALKASPVEANETSNNESCLQELQQEIEMLKKQGWSQHETHQKEKRQWEHALSVLEGKCQVLEENNKKLNQQLELQQSRLLISEAELKRAQSSLASLKVDVTKRDERITHLNAMIQERTDAVCEAVALVKDHRKTATKSATEFEQTLQSVQSENVDLQKKLHDSEMSVLALKAELLEQQRIQQRLGIDGSEDEPDFLNRMHKPSRHHPPNINPHPTNSAASQYLSSTRSTLAPAMRNPTLFSSDSSLGAFKSTGISHPFQIHSANSLAKSTQPYHFTSSTSSHPPNHQSAGLLFPRSNPTAASQLPLSASTTRHRSPTTAAATTNSRYRSSPTSKPINTHSQAPITPSTGSNT
ncbi:hypothetical protein Pelo_7075 [Pelomyxa schiedti]|nr:hypothetical protein Pelo_7075 [Pelomyxa schiedti]